jgi:hypothetical protein
MHRPIYQRAKYCMPACAEARIRSSEVVEITLPIHPRQLRGERHDSVATTVQRAIRAATTRTVVRSRLEQSMPRGRPPPPSSARGHFSTEPPAPIGSGQPSGRTGRASDPPESMFVRGTVSNRVTGSSWWQIWRCGR